MELDHSKPWLFSEEVGKKVLKSTSWTKTHIREVPYIFQYLDDTPSFNFRKGDIVKFGHGLITPYKKSWKDWFMTKEDYIKSWKSDIRIPRYAVKSYGIIAGRYRKIKYKHVKFMDYGYVIMMLSGSKVGHMRRYWVSCPFKKRMKFGEKIKSKCMVRKIPMEVVKIYNMDYIDSNSQRNLLLERIVDCLNN